VVGLVVVDDVDIEDHQEHWLDGNCWRPFY
jgi:hypothetical protein